MHCFKKCFFRISGLAIFAVTTMFCFPGDQPKTPRDKVTDLYHGHSIVDAYRWLEQMDSETTREWVDAQNLHLETFLENDGVRQKLYKHLLSLQQIGWVGLPIERGDRIFNSRVDATKGKSVLWLRDKDRERVLIDPTKEHEQNRLAMWQPCNSGRYLAYAVTQGQLHWGELRIIDLKTDQHYQERISRFYTRRNIVWAKNNSGFYYIHYKPPKQNDDLHHVVEQPSVRFHKLGTSFEQDRVLFRSPDRPELDYSLQLSDEGRYLLINLRNGIGPKRTIHLIDLATEQQTLFIDVPASYTFLGNSGSLFRFVTDHEAPRGRLVEIDLEKPEPKYWREQFPETSDTIKYSRGIGPYVVTCSSRDARMMMHVLDTRTGTRTEVTLPRLGWSWRMGGTLPGSDHLYYTLNGPFSPAEVYRLDLKSGKSSLWMRPTLPHDPDNYVLNQVFFPSSDGTRIPMFIAHRKDFEKNGQAPLFQYAYGALGWSAFPWYQADVMAWMDMGGVYAMPCIRGGGEYGAAWREQGSRRNKLTGIQDYVDASKWLIENRYTSKQKLVVNGRSASGFLPAIASLRHPDLYGAAIIDHPALDMLRYHTFTLAKHWIPEFGTSADTADFQVLREYSPYHNIRSDSCYPPTMVTVSDQDQTTVPMHGYKYVAAMQAAQQCKQPVLLQTVRGAGHSYGNNPDQAARSLTARLAFLVQVLDIEIPDSFGTNPEPKRR